jgi:hypothetical protein
MNPKEFMDQVHSKNLTFSWQPALPVADSRGPVGWFGPGYGPAEFEADRKRKWGVNDLDFKLPRNGIAMYFEIHNAEGLRYVQTLFQHLYPQVNIFIDYKKVKGDLKPECVAELKEIEDKNLVIEQNNAAIEEKCDALITELAKYAYISKQNEDGYDTITPKLEQKISTDNCYEWQQLVQYPVRVNYTERDLGKVTEQWYQTRIMHDC